MPAFPQSGPALDGFIKMLMDTQPWAFTDYEGTKRYIFSDALFQAQQKRNGYTITGLWENGEWMGFQGEFSPTEAQARYGGSGAGVVTVFPPSPVISPPTQPSGGAALSPPPAVIPATTASMPAPTRPTRLRPTPVPVTRSVEPLAAQIEQPSVSEGGISPILLIGGAVIVLLYFSSRR